MANRVSAASAALAAMTVFAAGAAGAARHDVSAQAGPPRTVAVTHLPLAGLWVDGSTLVWRTSERNFEFFDPAKRRVVSRLRVVAGRDQADCIDQADFVFARRQIVFACDEGDERPTSITTDIFAWTATLERPKPAAVGEFFANLLDDPSSGASFTAASDGRTIVYFGAGAKSDCECGWRQGVWQLVGRRSVRVPQQQGLLAGVAVSGQRLATLEWKPPCDCDGGAAWSPNGREVAWVHAKTIWLTDGHDAHRLSTAPVEAAPRWSPDGARLALTSKGFVTVLDRDGTHERQFVAGSAPAWSPDGTKLAFNRGKDLWLVNADGTGEKLLAANGSDPDWSPDGAGIAFSRAGSVYVVDVATGGERFLASVGTSSSQPRWSPDGKLLAVAAVAAGSSGPTGPAGELWVVQPDGSGARRVFADGYAPSWSPDGGRIAFWQRRFVPDTEVLYHYVYVSMVMNADGTQAQAPARGRDCYGTAWSPDGRAIAASCDKAGLWSIDSAGGTRLLAKPADELPSLEVRDLSTGKLIRGWQPPILLGDSVAFSGRYLVARGLRTSNPYRWILHRYDVTTGRALGTVPLESAAGDVSLAGRRAVYAAGRRIMLLDVKSGRRATLAVSARAPAGPVIVGNRVLWAERWRGGSRVREVVLP